MIGTIIGAIVVGAIIGALARLVMPGSQKIGIIMTIVLGALGGLAGSGIASLFGYQNASGGFAWIPFFIGIVAAIVFIAIYVGVTGRGSRTTPRT
jgi:uncharacterized membrane protein YeaQ/YmgE (transglycosylase-associated protein family)